MACFLFYVNKICRTKDKDENSELVTAISRTALSQAEKENNPFGNENSQICYFFFWGGGGENVSICSGQHKNRG